MAVGAGATGGSAVVKVDKRQEAGMLGMETVDVGQRIATARKHVAGIYTDAEAGLRGCATKRGDEPHELFVAAQHLRTLTGGGLQDDRTVGRGGGDSAGQIRAHVGNGGGRLLGGGFADVDDHSAGADGGGCAQIGNQQFGVHRLVGIGWRGQIDEILAVDEVRQRTHGGRGNRTGVGQIIGLQCHTGGLWARQKELVGAERDTGRHKTGNRVTDGAGLGDVVADVVGGDEGGSRSGGSGAGGGSGVEGCAVGIATGPCADIMMPERLLEGKHQIDVLSGGVQGGIGEQLEQEIGPVLFELPRHLDFKQLGGRAHVGMADDWTTGSHLCFIGVDIATGREANLPARAAEMLHVRRGGLGLGDLGEGRGRDGVVAVGGATGGDGRIQSGLRDFCRRKAQEILGDPAEEGVGVVVGKGGQKSSGITGSLGLGGRVGDDAAGQELLEGGGLHGIQTGEQGADTDWGSGSGSVSRSGHLVGLLGAVAGGWVPQLLPLVKVDPPQMIDAALLLSNIKEWPPPQTRRQRGSSIQLIMPIFWRICPFHL